MASSDSLKVAPIVTERGVGDVVAARYRLIRKVGSGGMGSVWYAQDLSLDAPCAVKLIDGEKAHDEGIRMRFEREAKASAQLRSAHVVNVFDYGEWNRTQYLAMEYLDGEDLALRLIRLGKLDFETTYRVIAHVARALMAAHAIGIVHRDLKPENIFLVQSYEEEIAKVLDFGIAQHNAYSIQDRATREGAFLGTPCYVSPEQARGRNIDHRSDLWSLGVITFQCLTGQLPFEGNALGELMGQILYEPLPIPSSLDPSLPKAFDDWWLRAASRDREERFQSAKEMADQLGTVLGIQSVVLVPTVPPQRRTSIPPAEYSGVITAAKLPQAAVRTTALAPDEDTGQDGFQLEANARLPLTRDEDLAHDGDGHGEVDEYLAQLAAEPLVPAASPDTGTGAAAVQRANLVSLPLMVPPAPGTDAKSQSAARIDAASVAEWEQASANARPISAELSPGAPREKQASEVRFIDRGASAAPVDVGSIEAQRQLPQFRSINWHVVRGWLARARQHASNRRRVALAVSITGALVVLCATLWLTLRTRTETVSTPSAKLQVTNEQPVANPGANPQPRSMSTAAEPLTVDMLPLISGKGRSSSRLGEAAGRASQPPAATGDPKQAPKGQRKVQPLNDYGI